MDDMSYSRSCDYDSRCFKQLKVMDDMDDSRSRELKRLNAMKNLAL